jgi:hypothetical protein
MIPDFADVFAAARKMIGDTETIAGAVATDDFLLGYGQSAYELMYDVLENNESPKIRRTAYWRIPAYTSYLHPSQLNLLGLPAMGEPINIWDRSEGQMIPIDTLTPVPQGAGDINPYMDVQAAGLATADSSVTDGSVIDITACNTCTADANDEWTVLRTETNAIRLLGCAALTRSPAPSSPSKGFILTGAEPWPRDPVPRGLNHRDLDGTLVAASTTISRWVWNDGAFRFRPVTQPRHLRIEYRISPNPPATTTDSLGVQGSLNFMAAYTAALFLDAKGAKGSAASKFLLACGDPTGEVGNGAKGYLGQMVRQHIKSEQRVRLIIPRFRPRRTTAFIPY